MTSVDDTPRPAAKAGAPRGRFGWLERHSWLGPLAALLALYAVFTLLTGDTFATLNTARTMVRQTTMVGIAALGMTLIVTAPKSKPKGNAWILPVLGPGFAAVRGGF